MNSWRTACLSNGGCTWVRQARLMRVAGGGVCMRAFMGGGGKCGGTWMAGLDGPSACRRQPPLKSFLWSGWHWVAAVRQLLRGRAPQGSEAQQCSGWGGGREVAHSGKYRPFMGAFPFVAACGPAAFNSAGWADIAWRGTVNCAVAPPAGARAWWLAARTGAGCPRRLAGLLGWLLARGQT